MVEILHKTEDGIPKVYPTRRRHGTSTYFTSAGDDLTDPENPITGGGDDLLFDMTDQDMSKTIDMVFSEDVYIKDGFVLFENAPFGASCDIEVHHPIAGKVATYGNKLPLLGTDKYDIASDDIDPLLKGLILRVTVNNGLTAAAFKVAGRVELFRVTTV